jgi:hypothetical protein
VRPAKWAAISMNAKRRPFLGGAYGEGVKTGDNSKQSGAFFAAGRVFRKVYSASAQNIYQFKICGSCADEGDCVHLLGVLLTQPHYGWTCRFARKGSQILRTCLKHCIRPNAEFCRLAAIIPPLWQTAKDTPKLPCKLLNQRFTQTRKSRF